MFLKHGIKKKPNAPQPLFRGVHLGRNVVIAPTYMYYAFQQFSKFLPIVLKELADYALFIWHAHAKNSNTSLMGRVLWPVPHVKASTYVYPSCLHCSVAQCIINK